LKKHAEGETLAVQDAKLGNLIKEKLGIPCIYSSGVMELSRGIRHQMAGLIEGLTEADLRPMSLGLSHSLSRYKLKFSPDKVDTMIVQVRKAGSSLWVATWSAQLYLYIAVNGQAHRPMAPLPPSAAVAHPLPPPPLPPLTGYRLA
jgi:hypothetical protein